MLLHFLPPPHSPPTPTPHPPPLPENGHKQTSLLCCLFSAKPVAVPWALICRRDIYSAVSRPEQWKKEGKLIRFHFLFHPPPVITRHFGWFTSGEARENTAGFFCARFAHVLTHDWLGKQNNCCWWGQAFREKRMLRSGIIIEYWSPGCSLKGSLAIKYTAGRYLAEPEQYLYQTQSFLVALFYNQCL